MGHTHADVSGGALRASVFGAMDGLVTNIALVAGVGAAGVSADYIVLTGLAGLVAVPSRWRWGSTPRYAPRTNRSEGSPSLATTVPWWISSVRQLAFGAIAAGATYLVGLVSGVSVVG